ncbi:MAG TPA: UDP-N-acetylmuramate dehydrogenase, partial [Microbacteriaceae bacterium]|nr:UDP-N-acetylmuramate dehydrogenase [Microbacteriaceae bacterium]
MIDSTTENDKKPTFADLTTMRVGGAPDNILVASNRDDLVSLASELMGSGEPWLPLGGGSNTIVSDAGYPGTVLLVRTSGISEIADETLAKDRVRIRIEAGQDWDELVEQCVERGMLGLEALSGIPGAVGAAPIQNIGAYGSELKETFHSLELLEEDTGEIRRVYAEEMGFGYRDSAIKRFELSGLVISIDLVLFKSTAGSENKVKVKHEQLARALNCQMGDEVPSASVRQSVIDLRRSKGMVLDENDKDSWSSGSFFINPIVSAGFARTLPADAPRFPLEGKRKTPTVIPLSKLHTVDQIEKYESDEGYVKISAAWLIEHSGIGRGFRLPGSGA